MKERKTGKHETKQRTSQGHDRHREGLEGLACDVTGWPVMSSCQLSQKPLCHKKGPSFFMEGLEAWKVIKQGEVVLTTVALLSL